MSEEGRRREFKIEGRLALLLMVAELLLFILSWLLSATRMEGVRSLLSSEGIRWFFGYFTQMVASPLLVWLLLGLCAYGCLQRSGLLSLLTSHLSLLTSHFSPLTYREKVALRVSLVFLVIYVVMIALLTLMPHAILLSATGSLFPSAFSRSLVPIIAFGLCLVSITFGLVSGRLRGLDDTFSALSYGIAQGSPLIILYLLLIQFYESLRFVFGI
jgi:aminobenzoyl-glutamate transport protein